MHREGRERGKRDKGNIGRKREGEKEGSVGREIKIDS